MVLMNGERCVDIVLDGLMVVVGPQHSGGQVGRLKDFYHL